MMAAWVVVGGPSHLWGAEAPAEVQAGFEREVRPILGKYCFRCHGEKRQKGDLNLQAFERVANVFKHRKTWEKVLHHVRTHEMPPEKKPQPTEDERRRLALWIESTMFTVDCDHPDPGRVTIRRLNRVEYNNTIRDLVGVNFRPANDFPADDSGYGFDNIGDVLSMSPLLLEKYLAAARNILDAAIVTDPSTNGVVKRIQAEDIESTAVGNVRRSRRASFKELMREGEIFTQVKIDREGEYILRARAYGDQAGPEPPKMELRLDGKAVKVFDVRAVEKSPQVYETRLTLSPGEKKLAAAYLNNYNNPKDPNPDNRDRNLMIDYLELVGPIGPQPLPETHRRIFFKQPTPETKHEVAKAIIGRFAERAFRRPLQDGELGRLFQFYQMVEADGGRFEEGIKLALEAVLVSPHFLFRGESQPDPNNPAAVYPVDEYALASRLSYFLWSSMPDAELIKLAGQGALRRELEAQTRRMLKDPKSEALVQNFVGQWLQLRNLEMAQPDSKQFPDFDDQLRSDMRRETELLFEHILREDRSVFEFINADYTFINERLARLYGIENVQGDQFRRVSLKGTPRGGILTQGSILTITSHATRTSPVKRGLFVLDNILGTPPPPPPPNVPPLKEENAAELTGTLRQKMEKHRADPICASCHARMDPIGFGFENFDAIGRWRTKEGPFDIDASGQLVSGEKFKGPAELRTILLGARKDEFVHCLVEKMLTYALGRGLEYYDKCATEKIMRNLAQRDYRFSELILEIVRSVPFQMRRGEASDLTVSSN
jgi:Protein of unknown function (DUF1592)/Protein of unknown function (DUF1588)/Protein of unknown function (DUF1587)/Protein of unknown function (DUF1585)/Protein of unknown function (DUF1595)/Ca-dependent carbohydrate-binding module xylan-binding/Planctomycete cytochrome C